MNKNSKNENISYKFVTPNLKNLKNEDFSTRAFSTKSFSTVKKLTKQSLNNQIFNLTTVNNFSNSKRMTFTGEKTLKKLHSSISDFTKERNKEKNIFSMVKIHDFLENNNEDYLNEDEKNKDLVGEEALINFRKSHKNLKKIQQKNEYKKIKNSIHIDMLNQAQEKNLLPRKVGIIKFNGNENEILLEFFFFFILFIFNNYLINFFI